MNPESIAPESYTLDAALLERPGNKEIQLDLFLDYASNVKLYPKFQAYLRESKPPLLAIWGKNDPFFIPAGAEAFRKMWQSLLLQRHGRVGSLNVCLRMIAGTHLA
jgi:hypothetical protein